MSSEKEMAQIHDKYGKSLFEKVAGCTFVDHGNSVKVQYVGGITASIDGTVNNECAVEIESRVDKQIRGAVLDLLCHPYPKKLLILLPVHMNNPEKTAIHCKWILEHFKKPHEQTEVILLEGSGDNPHQLEDTELIQNALKKLNCLGCK
jgi:hypothetical protein